MQSSAKLEGFGSRCSVFVLFVHKNKTSENMLKNAETTSSSHDNTYTYVQQIVGN